MAPTDGAGDDCATGSTLVDAWRTTADRLGDGPLIHHYDQTITASQARGRANALAAHFLAIGLDAGDRVAVCLQNDPEWLITLIGAWQAGLIVVPLNSMVRQAELTNYLTDSGAKVLVTNIDYIADVAASVLLDVRLAEVTVTDPPPVDHAPASAPTQTPAGESAVPLTTLDAVADEYRDARGVVRSVEPLDVASLTYTSGTTGPPKGAMNTHANMRHSAEVLTSWYGLGDGDVIWGVAPFFHITGLTAELALTMYAGLPLVMYHRFEPATALRYAERWHATYCVGAITAFIAMMSDPSFTERDLSSLTKIFTGGAPVSPTTVERFESLTGGYIHNGFGLTESTGPATFTPRGPARRSSRRAGRSASACPCPG
jgi:long-chain acyl-CoA synthetase